MHKGIPVSVMVLSAVMIASCATNRIHEARKSDLACKTPQSKYEYGRNLPTQAIRSNNRKYARNSDRTSWNNNRNRFAQRRNTRPVNDKDAFQNDQDRIDNLILPVWPGVDQQTNNLFSNLQSETNLLNDQYVKLRSPAGSSRIHEDIFIPPSDEVTPVVADIANDNQVQTSDTHWKKYTEGTIPAESPDETIVQSQNTNVPVQQQDEPSGRSEAFVYIMALLAGLIPFSVIKAYPGLAANISFWAAMNPWKTRLMFAGTNTAMIVGGLMLGENLADSGIHFSGISRYLLMGTFFASSLLYPFRNTSNRIFRHSYSKQKAFDLAVAISGFMLMVNVGNDPGARTVMTNMATFNTRDRQFENTVTGTGQTPRNLMYYETVGQVQDDQKTTDADERIRKEKIGNTVLVSILALLVAFGITVGACALSCNGMTGLAALVAIGGGGLLIGLTIWAIRKIWGPRSARKTKPPVVADPLPVKGTYRV